MIQSSFEEVQKQQSGLAASTSNAKSGLLPNAGTLAGWLGTFTRTAERNAMPEIKFEGIPADMLWLNALMHYPNDANRRDLWYRIGGILKRTENAKKDDVIGVTAFTLLQLMEAPSLDALTKTHQVQDKRGHLAGSVLLPLYLMEKTGIPNPSLNKVFTLLKNFASSEKAIYADDTKMATSENWHRQQWEEFKPVAHFWAALELNKENSRYAYAEPDTAFKTLKGFISFLGVAAAISEFGCSFIPKRAYPKVPVLDYSKAWTLPQEIPRLDVAKGMPPDKRILDWLGVYKKKGESKR